MGGQFSGSMKGVHEYAESRQFFANGVINTFNKYVMNDVTKNIIILCDVIHDVFIKHVMNDVTKNI